MIEEMKLDELQVSYKFQYKLNIKISEQEFCGALERYVVAELAANPGKCIFGHAKQSIPAALSCSVFAIKLV